MNTTVLIKKIKGFIQSYRKVILLFIIFWLPVISFLKLAGEIVEKEPLSFDNSTLLLLHNHATPLLDAFFLIITNVGGLVGVLVITVAFVAYFVRKKAYRSVLLLISGVGGAMIANTILKLLFHRDRPSLWQHMVIEKSFSFPSGHAMASAALASVLIILFWRTKYRWLVVAIATIVTILIGLSRLYLGVHYPSDVLAGWSVSVAWVVLISVIVSRVHHSPADQHKL